MDTLLSQLKGQGSPFASHSQAHVEKLLDTIHLLAQSTAIVAQQLQQTTPPSTNPTKSTPTKPISPPTPKKPKKTTIQSTAPPSKPSLPTPPLSPPSFKKKKKKTAAHPKLPLQWVPRSPDYYSTPTSTSTSTPTHDNSPPANTTPTLTPPNAPTTPTPPPLPTTLEPASAPDPPTPTPKPTPMPTPAPDPLTLTPEPTPPNPIETSIDQSGPLNPTPTPSPDPSPAPTSQLFDAFLELSKKMEASHAPYQCTDPPNCPTHKDQYKRHQRQLRQRPPTPTPKPLAHTDIAPANAIVNFPHTGPKCPDPPRCPSHKAHFEAYLTTYRTKINAPPKPNPLLARTTGSGVLTSDGVWHPISK